MQLSFLRLRLGRPGAPPNGGIPGPSCRSSLAATKDFYRGLCDEAEAAGRIVASRGQGRGGQVLRGLPLITEAFEKHRQEQGTMMEEVPLAPPSAVKVKRKRKSQPR